MEAGCPLCYRIDWRVGNFAWAGCSVPRQPRYDWLQLSVRALWADGFLGGGFSAGGVYTDWFGGGRIKSVEEIICSLPKI